MVKRVLLAAPRGFCAGVERAIETVERALELYGPPVYVRKQIVHNVHVVRDLERRGAVFVESEESVPAGAKLVLARRPALGPARKVLQQHAEPLGSLRVMTRRVQARKRRMRQEVDRTIWSSSSSDAAPARARPSR